MNIRTMDKWVDYNEEDIEITQSVMKIIQDVKKRGDEALIEYSKRFDDYSLKKENIIIDEKELKESFKRLENNLIEAIKKSIENVRLFSEKQLKESFYFEVDNKLLGDKITPIKSVGVYVPGGRAAYPSSIIMSVIPAKVAGVSDIVITTPPIKDDKIRDVIYGTAWLCGIKKAYTVGGAQGIAALAYGTESIKKVNMIVGPGNIYVATAKKLVFGDVGIDSITGPSEIGIVADENANQKYIALDMLSQSEHDPKARVVLFTNSSSLIQSVEKEINNILPNMKRKEIMKESLEKYGRIILTNSLEDAFKEMNKMAPEHLEVLCENPKEKLSLIENAGAIFLGEYSPVPMGDYIAGPSHVLPTSSTAKFSSPTSVDTFLKQSSVIFYKDKESYKKEVEYAIKIANIEDLEVHALAMKERLKNA